MIDKSMALKVLRPGSPWTLRGDKLEWLDPTIQPPTDAEINDCIKNYVEPPTLEDRITELEVIIAKLQTGN